MQQLLTFKSQGYVTNDTNTTYSAGTHLALSGTTFNLDLATADKVVNIGHNSTNNEGEIILDTSNAGSPQISFTEHGDASWAIGVDDTDNSFKIHGSPNSTIPTINSLTTPLFEIDTNGVGYLQGSRIFADNYHPNADALTTARTISLGVDLTGSASFNGSSNITINAQIAANAVGTSEIATDAVGASEIAAGAVGSSELATNSVTATKIAGSAVGASELNVVGNGTTAQFLRSDGDGTFTWATPIDTNTQLTSSEVRANISGTGLFSYNSSTGVISTTANNYSLPEATATVRGGIELFSNTDQSVAANTVSSTAGRTYGIQLNSAGQAVVNVPWSDTNTDTNTFRTVTAGGNTLGSSETFGFNRRFECFNFRSWRSSNNFIY